MVVKWVRRGGVNRKKADGDDMGVCSYRCGGVSDDVDRDIAVCL